MGCVCLHAGAYVSVFVIMLNYVWFLLLVMCLSYRYGRQSTPEHNYLALQKSLCPQGMTEQRETVMLLAVGWDMHIGIVFLTTQMIGVADISKTVRLTKMQLHKRKGFLFSKRNPSLSN